METSYSDFRQNLKKFIDEVSSTHEATIITSHNKPKAVLLSYEDYRSLEETAYLLRSPKNAQRLLQSIENLSKHKNIVEHNIADED